MSIHAINFTGNNKSSHRGDKALLTGAVGATLGYAIGKNIPVSDEYIQKNVSRVIEHSMIKEGMADYSNQFASMIAKKVKIDEELSKIKDMPQWHDKAKEAIEIDAEIAKHQKTSRLNFAKTNLKTLEENSPLEYVAKLNQHFEKFVTKIGGEERLLKVIKGAFVAKATILTGCAFALASLINTKSKEQ